MQDIVSHSVSYSRKKLQVANHVQNPPLYSYEHDTHLRATCICFTAHEWKVQNLSRQGNSLRVFWTHDKTTRANFVCWYSGMVAKVERFVQHSYTTTYTANIQAQHTGKSVCLTLLLFSSSTVINQTVWKSTTNGCLLDAEWGGSWSEYTSVFLVQTSMLLRKEHIASGGSQMVCLLKRVSSDEL